MKIFSGLLNEFIYFYPMIMSIIWTFGGLIFFFRREQENNALLPTTSSPFFSIIVPCHNEAAHIAKTARHLLTLNYPSYEIIFVDDGSRDRTREEIRLLCKEHPRIRGIYLDQNQGKASALNVGCLAAKSELLVTMDADALLDRNALHYLAHHFIRYPRVGAVTGNPRVLNRTTLLAKIQVGEYATIIGLIKRSQRLLGKVLTVSGVLAAFRRSALLSVGFWDTDMLTEDIDITWKLEKNFWDIRYEARALCWILVPETISGLWRQRLRWAEGGIQVLCKHKDIWSNWEQRRLWPVYVEFIISIFWSYAFWAFVLLWLVQLAFGTGLPIQVAPLIPPRWTGAILAVTCLFQFCVSLLIDHRYEKNMLKYLFWVIWYPFAYWMINSLTQVVATPRALLRQLGQRRRAVWTSPDRGLG